MHELFVYPIGMGFSLKIARKFSFFAELVQMSLLAELCVLTVRSGP
jgi:hypothetical protein